MANNSDGTQLSAVLVDGPQHAAFFNLEADGSFSYLALPDYFGSDSFKYKAFDGELYSAIRTVALTVGDTYDAPPEEPPVDEGDDNYGDGSSIDDGEGDGGDDSNGGTTDVASAVADDFNVLINSTLTVSIDRAITKNDHGNSPSVTLLSNPTAGTLELNSNGTFTYVAPDSAGNYSFDYCVTCDGVDSAPATVTIHVGDPNLYSVEVVASKNASKLQGDGNEMISGIWTDDDNNGDDDSGGKQTRFANTADRPISLNVAVSFKDDFIPDSVKIRGSVMAGTTLEGVAVVLEWEGTLSKEGTKWKSGALDPKAGQKLPDKIGLIQNLQIKWEVQVDGKGDWKEAGISSFDRVYAIRSGLLPGFSYETVVQIGTAALAGSVASTLDDSTVVETIFAKFKTFDLHRVSDNKLITYYADWATDNADTRSLLNDAESPDGKCGAIANLFADTLRVQGVDSVYEAELVPNQTMALAVEPGVNYGILVNDWAFGEEKFSLDGFSYHALLRSNPGFSPSDTGSYNLINSDFSDSSGTSGQGRIENPASFFLDHEVVHVNGKYYDPSYGKVYVDELDFQRQSLAGIVRITRTNEVELGEDLDHDGIRSILTTYNILDVQKVSEFYDTRLVKILKPERKYW